MLVDAQKCAENMRQEMANVSINTSRGPVRITVSIGISGVEQSRHDNQVTVHSLLKMASENLYASICVTSAGQKGYPPGRED
jgi:GGDEF domain-containing protein